MLKCDFHNHTFEDPEDCYKTKYTSKELIDFASARGFDVLAITLHNKLHFNEELNNYAKKKGILLIPGIEVRVGLQDFLVLMKKPIREIEKVNDYEALKKFKKKHSKEIIIIAAHLFYPRFFLFPIKPRFDVADAFEFSHFYNNWINPNKKAVALAKKVGKPMIGNSDTHQLWQMNHTYSVINSKKDIDSVFSAIKKGNVSVITEPFFIRTFLYMTNPLNIFSDIMNKRRLIRQRRKG